jgi:hypothetical protein
MYETKPVFGDIDLVTSLRGGDQRREYSFSPG